MEICESAHATKHREGNNNELEPTSPRDNGHSTAPQAPQQDTIGKWGGSTELRRRRRCQTVNMSKCGAGIFGNCPLGMRGILLKWTVSMKKLPSESHALGRALSQIQGTRKRDRGLLPRAATGAALPFAVVWRPSNTARGDSLRGGVESHNLCPQQHATCRGVQFWPFRGPFSESGGEHTLLTSPDGLAVSGGEDPAQLAPIIRCDCVQDRIPGPEIFPGQVGCDARRGCEHRSRRGGSRRRRRGYSRSQGTTGPVAISETRKLLESGIHFGIGKPNILLVCGRPMEKGGGVTGILGSQDTPAPRPRHARATMDLALVRVRCDVLRVSSRAVGVATCTLLPPSLPLRLGA
eukprot:gene19668-biopygen8493